MGHTCSKASYYETDYGDPSSYSHGIDSSFVLTESNPRARRRRSKKLNTGTEPFASNRASTGIARSDPALFALQERSMKLVEAPNDGQFHLLFKQQMKQKQVQAARLRRQWSISHQQPLNVPPLQPPSTVDPPPAVPQEPSDVCLTEPFDDDEVECTSYSTRLVVRRHNLKTQDEGMSGTHIYAVRWPQDEPLSFQWHHEPRRGKQQQEQAPLSARSKNINDGTAGNPVKHSIVSLEDDSSSSNKAAAIASDQNGSQRKLNNSSTYVSGADVDSLFNSDTMAVDPKKAVRDWVTVSEEHNIYIADTGLTPTECDEMVQITEQVCRGQYAAYTYAKQTLGCREFPPLAQAVQDTVHTTVHGILNTLGVPSSKNRKNISGEKSSKKLALDDREPHMVKYDVTKKERQKLDMHTDKSEWTFLITLSNGCGVDYEGGGTYFECLDATIHIQRGHALIFPGKLRHCGQRITHGLRFLLVGFLVDKVTPAASKLKPDKKGEDKEDEDVNYDDAVRMGLMNVP